MYSAFNYGPSLMRTNCPLVQVFLCLHKQLRWLFVTWLENCNRHGSLSELSGHFHCRLPAWKMSNPTLMDKFNRQSAVTGRQSVSEKFKTLRGRQLTGLISFNVLNLVGQLGLLLSIFRCWQSTDRRSFHSCPWPLKINNHRLHVYDSFRLLNSLVRFKESSEFYNKSRNYKYELILFE